MTYDITAPVPERLRALAKAITCGWLLNDDDRCVACALTDIAAELDPEGARAIRDKRIQAAIAS